jgi:hypothetical protein
MISIPTIIIVIFIIINSISTSATTITTNSSTYHHQQPTNNTTTNHSTINNNDVCGIACFFNPANSQLRITNYKKFRSRTREQGLRMVITELLFPNQTSGIVEFEENWTIVIHREIKNKSEILWQKEALLNLALRNIPENWFWCTKIVWLDTDILLEDGWIEKTSQLLSNRHAIGQIFTHLVQLPEQFVGFPEPIWARARLGRLPYGTKPFHVRMSANARGSIDGGYPGFAWGATRSLLGKIELYDRAIVGGFDALLFNLVSQYFFENHEEEQDLTSSSSTSSTIKNDGECEARFNEEMYQHFYQGWGYSLVQYLLHHHQTMINSQSLLQANIYAAHLWHGDRDRRGYQNRHQILLKVNYHPIRDVQTVNGILNWISSDEVLDEIQQLFQERDG